MGFYRKFHCDNGGPFDSLKDDSTAEIVRFKWATIPRFSPHNFLPTISPFFEGIKSRKSGKCMKNQNKI